MKETIISASENTRVVRLGGVRYDWRVEKFIRELLKTLDAKDYKTWGERRRAAYASAEELGWRRNDLGNWERE
jgi:hypothetical protein